ncbi:hypothetical protein PYCCODRAFT_1459153 [Trametes coccinea BRFM310]|uniref:Fungal-type protein kinase domain-containing protein n=1 Tax=Trametes coccinea (strain BRFM310) TaxID=1353009 RepID=A0A1Y2IM35_TRAC3|nr:hypothetical protein PYCCODRAFT_1459153 [Trametes coccinea BRFM310]
MYENLSASRIGCYGASASHFTVQAELVDKVQLNDGSVLQRLKIDSVSSDMVRLCQQKLEEGGAVYGQVKALQNMARRADRMTVAQLESEAEEEQHDYDDDLSDSETAQAAPNVKKSRRERNMYEPLEAIFDAISSVPTGPDEAPGSRPKRCFRNQAEVLIPDEEHTLGYPRFIPDFSLLEDPSLHSSKLWSDRAGFIEVKASSQQRPEVDVEKREVSRILTQVAHYARLHLSARPFSVFSVSIMIFGCDFCVSIFDRGGAQVSPIYNMFRNSDTFIRVIRSVTRILSDAELGRDPSVSLAPSSVSSSSDGPAWIVGAVGSDRRQWCTTGPAIWSSLSLFGRATAVWPVREINEHNELVGDAMILKSTWRSSDRDPESFVYQNIKGSHPGLAKFIAGGDAVFPSHNGNQEAITVHSLRGVPVSRGERTKVLHRLLIESVGKPVWMYETDRELLEGLIGALKAHRFLSEQEILHRDVSAGNVLLALDPKKQGTAGFLTDLEYARMEAPITKTSLRQETVEASTAYGPLRYHLQEPMQRTHTTFVASQRGAGIFGTLQFMSRRLLAALMSGQQSVTTTVQDDVESFFWVLLYAVLRRLVMVHVGSAEEREGIKEAFCKAFGGVSLRTIYDSRANSYTLNIWALPLVERFTSGPMQLIFQKYMHSVHAQLESDIQQRISSRLQAASPSPAPKKSRKSKKREAADFTYEGMLGILEHSVKLLTDSPEQDFMVTFRKDQ